MKKATEVCKVKDASTFTLQRSVAQLWKEDKIAFWSAEEFLEAFQREEILQRLYIRGDAIEERVLVLDVCSVGATTYFSHTVEAVLHLWSLGVLTAAGCGIGSVHAVVRSNLLVEPSEVEEWEISVSGALFIFNVQEQRAIAAQVCIGSA
ncbi:hypothetical protein F511_02660 [Dorcoceras hygrometricum]|uniref:Uncharacterized protein n=1 Tax=Dorcoceras hygrometricum TaxID=472368 RepID=A0A2Z7DBJ3_9LAMI|nr:hypothetical protein F511_02660 [Dorcoceras hygrometricum]